MNEPVEAQHPAEVLMSHVSATCYSTEPIKMEEWGEWGGRFYVPGVQWGIHTSDTVFSKGRVQRKDQLKWGVEKRPSKMGEWSHLGWVSSSELAFIRK